MLIALATLGGAAVFIGGYAFLLYIMTRPDRIGSSTNNVVPEKAPSRFLAIPVVLCGIAVEIVVGRFEPETIAKASGNSTASILVATLIFWNSHRKLWFWIFLFTMLFVHMAAVVSVPWPNAPTPSGHKDVFIIFFLLDLIATLSFGAAAAALNRKLSTLH